MNPLAASARGFSEQNKDDNEKLETMDDCHATHSRHRLTGTDKAFG